MKKTVCIWCSSVISVNNDYDERNHKAVCSPSCKASEILFTFCYGDEEIYRRDMWNTIKEERSAKKKAKGAS